MGLQCELGGDLWHVIAELIALVGIRTVQFIEVGEDSVLCGENGNLGETLTEYRNGSFFGRTSRLE